MKVILADDHQIVIDGLRAILQDEEYLEIVGEFANGREVLAFCESGAEFDIAILDINMPGKDGIECTEQIKKLDGTKKVLILTMYNDPEYIKQLMEIGADGFILKNTGRIELLTALEMLGEGNTYFGQDVTSTLAKSYQKKGSDNGIRLTKREIEIVQLLAEGLTSIQIAEKLFLSPYTIDTHRKNIMNKFEVHSTIKLLECARTSGLL